MLASLVRMLASFVRMLMSLIGMQSSLVGMLSSLVGIFGGIRADMIQCCSFFCFFLVGDIKYWNRAR